MTLRTTACLSRRLMQLLIAFAVSSHPLWAADRAQSSTMAELAVNLPESGEIHLAMYNQEQPDGFMRLGWYQRDDSLFLYDRTMMPSMEIYESLEAELGSRDFTPRSVSIRFNKGSAVMLIDAILEPNAVRGERRVERPGVAPELKPVQLETPENTMLRASTFLLPLVMSQEPGSQLEYEWYAPLGNAVQSVSLTVRDGGMVDTPAGSFETVCYELRGGTPENDIYVTRGPEPRIVRIDVLGQPLKFLAPAPAN